MSSSSSHPTNPAGDRPTAGGNDTEGHLASEILPPPADGLSPTPFRKTRKKPAKSVKLIQPALVQRAILAPAASQSHDFIADYVTYADRYELPAIIHEFVAITTIAALTNGKIWIKSGGTRLPLDLWALLISPSGSGRNTSLRPMRELLRVADLDLISRNSWGSSSQMQQYFADQGSQSVFHVWPEMSKMINEFNHGYFRGAKEFLTDLYDEVFPPAGKEYRDRADDEEKTPEIVFEDAPRSCLLATSSSAWFFGSIKPDDVRGGFIPRWCPVVGQSGPSVAFVSDPNPALVRPLVDKIRMLNSLEGEMDFSHLKERYTEWYDATRARFLRHPATDFSMAFFGRHRNHLYKLAAIVELSTSGTLRVCETSWERAVAYARMLENNIFELLKTNFSLEGVESQRLEDLIRAAGPKGYTKSDFSVAYRGQQRLAAMNRLKNLVDAEVVHVFTRNTGGRSAHILVSAEHLLEHGKMDLRDTPAVLWRY